MTKEEVSRLLFECTRRSMFARNSFDNGDIDKCELRIDELSDFLDQAMKALIEYKALTY